MSSRKWIQLEREMYKERLAMEETEGTGAHCEDSSGSTSTAILALYADDIYGDRSK